MNSSLEKKVIFILMTLCIFGFSATSSQAAKQISIEEQGQAQESESYKHYILGQLYEREHKLEEAKSEYLKALDYDEASLAINTTLARICIKLSQWEEAEYYLKRAKELYPDSTKPMYLLALVYTHHKKIDLAVKEYEAILEIDPEDLTALGYVADLYIIQNRLEEAIEAYEKIIELEPAVGLVYFNLGILYSKLEKYDEAIKVLEKAKELEPEYASSYLALGVVYELKGERQKAISL